MSATGQRAKPRRACALLLALVLGGCSLRLVHPAPHAEDWPNPVTARSSQEPCTSTPAPPVADVVIGSTLGTLTYVERHSGSPAITIGLGVAMVPVFVSAIYGFVHTARCRRYEALFRSTDAGQ